ncbi:MAG: hypothetical protein DMG93_11665 [Acidobacteria bacterium]|nr:MAG: hypothetical protein DMG93_11665 [Acidobacteriota bacterium]
MIQKTDLLHVPVFADLPNDQIAWFLSQCQEQIVKPGDTYIHAGDPAENMFVILEGEFQARGEINGEAFAFPVKAGEVTGLLPFSRMKKTPVTGRAMTNGRLLRFSSSHFPELVQKMPELATRLVGLMSDRIRETTRFEQQRDRLASLGKLSAGLAHELNNPASAAKRAAGQLRQILKRIKDASHELGRRDLTREQKVEIENLETSLVQKDEPPPDALAASDIEEQIDSLLRSHGQNDLWQLSVDLARRGVKPAALESLFANLEPETARAALIRLAASIEVANLLNEIESSAARISDLVLAIKEYTYMDQSPIQNVDVIKSLENTLTILNHKLKRGVEVKRDYQQVPLLVNSFGSELSQVWTVVVEIGDNGPGIPAEVEAHIFEPFFTTKGVGQGTGLGLDTVQRIVRKHRGNVQVDSQPGDTRFQVWLPLSEAAG